MTYHFLRADAASAAVAGIADAGAAELGSAAMASGAWSAAARAGSTLSSAPGVSSSGGVLSGRSSATWPSVWVSMSLMISVLTTEPVDEIGDRGPGRVESEEDAGRDDRRDHDDDRGRPGFLAGRPRHLRASSAAASCANGSHARSCTLRTPRSTAAASADERDESSDRARAAVHRNASDSHPAVMIFPKSQNGERRPHVPELDPTLDAERAQPAPRGPGGLACLSDAIGSSTSSSSFALPSSVCSAAIASLVFVASLQARRDSNPQPADLESAALPLELLA